MIDKCSSDKICSFSRILYIKLEALTYKSQVIATFDLLYKKAKDIFITSLRFKYSFLMVRQS